MESNEHIYLAVFWISFIIRNAWTDWLLELRATALYADNEIRSKSDDNLRHTLHSNDLYAVWQLKQIMLASWHSHTAIYSMNYVHCYSSAYTFNWIMNIYASFYFWFESVHLLLFFEFFFSFYFTFYSTSILDFKGTFFEFLHKESCL